MELNYNKGGFIEIGNVQTSPFVLEYRGLKDTTTIVRSALMVVDDPRVRHRRWPLNDCVVVNMIGVPQGWFKRRILTRMIIHSFRGTLPIAEVKIDRAGITVVADRTSPWAPYDLPELRPAQGATS